MSKLFTLQVTMPVIWRQGRADFSEWCVVTLKQGEILVEVKVPFLLACDPAVHFICMYLLSFQATGALALSTSSFLLHSLIVYLEGCAWECLPNTEVCGLSVILRWVPVRFICFKFWLWCVFSMWWHSGSVVVATLGRLPPVWNLGSQTRINVSMPVLKHWTTRKAPQWL